MIAKRNLRKQFNKDCLERDDNKCRVCDDEEATAVHHITDRKEMPNGGYHYKNGISLCDECHKKAEIFHMTSGKKWAANMHPNDLYNIIDSSKEEAVKECEKLTWKKS